jgi:hypothetical protein
MGILYIKTETESAFSAQWRAGNLWIRRITKTVCPQILSEQEFHRIDSAIFPITDLKRA